MKILKVFLTVTIFSFAVLGFIACGGKQSHHAQGITDDEILIGNTATTSGGVAVVGVPFNQAIQAEIERYNNLPENERYLGGRKIRLITYDDKFDAATGKSLTEKLVEEDKIFALVGHFGTPTVGATIDYIKEIGVPMVYAATGINALYDEKNEGSPVMPVQPIYLTDGRIMAARLLHENLPGKIDPTQKNGNTGLSENSKVGVLYTGDDAGKGILAGVRREFELEGKKDNLIEQQFDSASDASVSAAVRKMSDENVESIVIAANQNPFKIMLTALANAGNTASVFTSYVNADPTAFDGNIVYNFNIYANAWVDVLSEEGQIAAGNYVSAISNSSLPDDVKATLPTNAFGTAGYIAIRVFLQGLEQLDSQLKKGDAITWEKFINAMESAKIAIPMGTDVDFSNGKRWGIANMALLRFARGDVPKETAGAKAVHDSQGNIIKYVADRFVGERSFEPLESIEKK